MKDSNQKRKILKDRKFPQADQVNKYQDFNSLHKNYLLVKKAFLSKMLVWSGSVVGLAAVAGLVLVNSKTDQPGMVKEKTAVQRANQTRVQPPIPGKNVPFEVYRISAKKGGTITYPTGSSIEIPANAFADVKSDTLEVRYREFHTPLDIFLSGIPMQYDSGGITRTLETAGMLEIRAFDKGKELKLKEGSSISVKLASSSSDPKFNLYELDTLTQNWLDRGKDQILLPGKTSAVHTTRSARQNGISKKELAKPEVLAPGKYSFSITYDNEEFPELSAYDGVLFEVTDNSFKSAYYKVNWNKIFLSPGKAKGEYLIRLKKADTTISVTAKPVFEKEDYAKALARFEQHQKEISQLDNRVESERQAKLNKVNSQLSAYSRRDMYMAANGMIRSSDPSMRGFSVFSTGFHNIDCPLPPAFAYVVSLRRNLPDPKTNVVSQNRNYTTIYLVEKGKNTVFRFTKGEPVKYNPEAKNLMWTVTEASQIAFFRIKDYSALSRTSENRIDPVVAKNQDLALAEIKAFSEK